MIRLVYNLISFGINLYWWFSAFIGNQKSKSARKGRENWIKKLTQLYLSKHPIWIHASSHGEGLMAMPLINQILNETDEDILVTFFSPSGFEHFKHGNKRVKKIYLPLDYFSTTKKFIQITNPRLVIFVKYDLWMNFISQIIKAKIPSFCFSIKVPFNHWYFRWYGKIVMKKLSKMNGLLTVDDDSFKNLNAAGLTNVKMCGDTRYDQVSLDFNPVFKNIMKPCLILGSSWEAEETILSDILDDFSELQLIIAPHDVSTQRLSEIKKRFGKNCELLSACKIDEIPHVLVIDKIGLLAELYSNSDFAFIGGGFEGKLHNIIEPAAKRNVILFGPNIDHFPEAIEMEKEGFAKRISNGKDLKETISSFVLNPDELKRIKDTSYEFVKKKRGASQIVFEEIRGFL